MDLIMMVLSTVGEALMNSFAFIMDTVAMALLDYFMPVIGMGDGQNISNIFESYGVSDNMDKIFPFFRPANQIFVYIAFVLIVIIFTFNVIRSFKPGLSREEGLITHIYRAILACCLVGLSYALISWIMYLGYMMINYMMTFNYFDVKAGLGQSIADQCTRGVEAAGIQQGITGTVLGITLIVPLILFLAICWNFIKLFLEIAERVVVTTFCTSLAPLGFCAVISKETEGITYKYLQMVFSCYLVTILDVWFIRAFIYSVYSWTDLIDTPTFVWKMVMWLALLIVAQRADQYLRESGLSVAQTGGNLLGEMMLSGRMLAGGSRTAGRLANAGSRFGGGSGGSTMPMSRQVGKSASDAMGRIIGPSAAGQLKASGKMNFTNDSHFVEPTMKNGKATGFQGQAASERGNTFGFKSVGSREEAEAAGMSAYVLPNGQTIGVWGDGARDLVMPNGAAVGTVEDGALRDAESGILASMADGTDAAPSEEKINDAVRAAQEQMFAGGSAEETEANILGAVTAAEDILPPEIMEQEAVVGAYSLPNEPDDTCHVLGIDKSTGAMVTHDVTSGNIASMTGFEDRTPETTEGIGGFSYSDANGNTVTGYSSVISRNDKPVSVKDGSGHDVKFDGEFKPMSIPGAYSHTVTNQQGKSDQFAYLSADRYKVDRNKENAVFINGRKYYQVKLPKDGTSAFPAQRRTFRRTTKKK